MTFSLTQPLMLLKLEEKKILILAKPYFGKKKTYEQYFVIVNKLLLGFIYNFFYKVYFGLQYIKCVLNGMNPSL